MTYLNGHTEAESRFHPKLTQEFYGGELYEYYPLGKYIVAAPGVCGGRPTFKYTRLEVSMILSLLSVGDTVESLLRDYHNSKISAEAIYEAIQLARDAMLDSTSQLRTKPISSFELVQA